MAGTDTRIRCPWCMTRVNRDATICHSCGAVRTRVPVSMFQVFFLSPLVGFALMLIGISVFGMGFTHAAVLFGATWAVLALAHVIMRLRKRWLPVEPLLLEDEKAETAQAFHAPAGWAPWWAGAGTVAAGLALIWAISPKASMVDPNSSSVVLTISSASASVPEEPIPVVTPSSAGVPVSVAAATSAAPPASPAPMPVAAAPAAASVAPAPLPSPAATTVVAQSDAAVQAQPPVDPADATAKAEAPAADRNTIQSAQRLLDSLGYSVGSIDGKAGLKTRQAIRTFRSQMGLAGGEEVDAGLMAALQAFARKMEIPLPATQQAEDWTAPAQPDAKPVRAAQAAQPRPAAQPEWKAVSAAPSARPEPARSRSADPRSAQADSRVVALAEPPRAEPSRAEPLRIEPPRAMPAAVPQPPARIPSLAEIRQLQQAEAARQPATATLASTDAPAIPASMPETIRLGAPIRLH